MKYNLLFISVAILITLARCQTDEAVKTCQEKHNIDDKDVSRIAKGFDLDLDENIKCFVHCVLDVTGFLDDEGLYNMNSYASEHISDDARDEMITCKQKHDGKHEKCDYAYNMVYCLQNNNSD